MHKLNNLKKEAEHIRLTSAEKSAMRTNIFKGANAGAFSAHKSPYMFYSFFAHHMRVAVAGVLVFMLAGAGSVSAAAQGALPGDILYPIKVSVNERVEVALASDADAKSLVEVKLADRRVGEAQALLEQGRLDEETADSLGEDFDAHATQALALATPAEDQPEVQVVSAEATPVSESFDTSVDTPASASEPALMLGRNAKSVSVTRTMMAPVAIAPDLQEGSATTTDKELRVKKFEKHHELRESLRVKREIIKELKVRSLKKPERRQN